MGTSRNNRGRFIGIGHTHGNTTSHKQWFRMDYHKLQGKLIMKQEYRSNLEKLKKLLSIQKIKIYPAEESDLNEYKRLLYPYLVPSELIILYQYMDGNMIDGDNYIIGFSLSNTIESLQFRTFFEGVLGGDWIPALLPIGSTDNTSVFTILSKKPQWICPVYCIGEGDGELELIANSLNELIRLRIALLENDNDSSIDELYSKYTPDAYLNNIEQQGVYSKNGVRNIYRIDDRESLPKEWFE